MREQHTPGRLKAIKHSIYSDDDGHSVAMTFLISQSEHDEANARRLVACWNACEDITTAELEEIATTGGMLGPREDVARIAKHRDELLAALKGLLVYFESGNSVPVSQATIKSNSAEVLAARAATAKAGGDV